MQQFASTFIYRNLDIHQDLPALVSMLKDVEQTDQVGEDVSEAALHEQLTWSGQDPALNNRVVTLPDASSIIGCGLFQKTPNDENADMYIAVSPSYRRCGIGSQLFARLLARAGELNARALRVYVNARNEGAALFVRKHGFEPISTYTRLRVPAGQTFPDPVLPDGFTIRSYDQLKRVDLYTEASNRGYEGQWGHLHVTEEEVAAFLLRLNSAGIFLLFAPDGRAAGTCRANFNIEDTTRTALIDAPGVAPEYRAAGLALPLLLAVIRWLLPQKPAMLELEAWGDTPENLALYRELGFQTVREEISYRREVRDEEQRQPLNREAVDRLQETREAILRAHPGQDSGDSAEILHELREERTRELEER
jgi:mycothiol synthase